MATRTTHGGKTRRMLLKMTLANMQQLQGGVDRTMERGTRSEGALAVQMSRRFALMDGVSRLDRSFSRKGMDNEVENDVSAACQLLWRGTSRVDRGVHALLPYLA